MPRAPAATSGAEATAEADAGEGEIHGTAVPAALAVEDVWRCGACGGLNRGVRCLALRCQRAPPSLAMLDGSLAADLAAWAEAQGLPPPGQEWANDGPPTSLPQAGVHSGCAGEQDPYDEHFAPLFDGLDNVATAAAPVVISDDSEAEWIPTEAAPVVVTFWCRGSIHQSTAMDARTTLLVALFDAILEPPMGAFMDAEGHLLDPASAIGVLPHGNVLFVPADDADDPAQYVLTAGQLQEALRRARGLDMAALRTACLSLGANAWPVLWGSRRSRKAGKSQRKGLLQAAGHMNRGLGHFEPRLCFSHCALSVLIDFNCFLQHLSSLTRGQIWPEPRMKLQQIIFEF